MQPAFSLSRNFNPQLLGAVEALLSSAHPTGTNKPWCKDMQEAICPSIELHPTCLPRYEEACKPGLPRGTPKSFSSWHHQLLCPRRTVPSNKGTFQVVLLWSQADCFLDRLTTQEGDSGVGPLCLTTASVTSCGLRVINMPGPWQSDTSSLTLRETFLKAPATFLYIHVFFPLLFREYPSCKLLQRTTY